MGKALLNSALTEEEFKRRLSLIETILANKFPDLTQEMIMQILDLNQADITQSRFYQEIMTKGLQEGRRAEATALVLRQLKRRLGRLPLTQEKRVQALSVEQLEVLGEALLDFTDIADLESCLAGLN
ncbi:MAG: DUF4351 domain-containing protein [Synechococcus sp.]|nr:DUF4351 domain-containing protein [Synechococcus sp.]